jgi:predicted ester cyclase
MGHIPRRADSAPKIFGELAMNTGTHTIPFFAGIPPTGRKMSLGTIDIWRVENGKLAQLRLGECFGKLSL